MVDLNELQKTIYQNKVKKGFNITNIPQEFCYIYGEVGEAYEAWIYGYRRSYRPVRRSYHECC